MTMQKLEKDCKYECGFIVVWKGRTGQPGSTGFFEKNSTIEHTFNRCKEIKEKGLKQGATTAPLPKDQTTLPQQSTASQQYVTVEKRVESGDSPTGINLNSVYIIASDARKEIRELRKDIKTLMDVLDGIAQNQTLIIERVGYPKPEPAATTTTTETTVKLSNEELNDMMESDAQAMEDMERERAEMEEEAKKKQQNIKIRTHLDQMPILQDEPIDKEKVGDTSVPCSNCQERFEPDELWSNKMGKIYCHECFQLFKYEKEETIIPRVVDGNGWGVISERFICHKCQGLKHNGYEKVGTKVCDDCKMEIEAKEALAELENDNEEDENLRLRTEQDIINNGDDYGGIVND